VRRKALTADAKALRFARCCYDHLAGQLGVAVTEAVRARGFIMPAADKRFTVTPAGFAWFAGIGLDVAAVKPTRRGLARQCLDWTERTHHLAGPLGVQFMTTLCANGWLRRAKESRAVETTPKGRVELDASPRYRRGRVTASARPATGQRIPVKLTHHRVD
jgi:hypothetical protein